VWVKIAAGLATPLLAVMLVVGVLHASHRTTFPALLLPSVSSASVTTSSGESESGDTHHCLGKVSTRSQHFAGLAVKGGIAAQADGFAHATGNAPQIVEYYNRLKNGFNAGEAQTVMSLGKIPFIQLNPKGTPPAEIAAGKYDKILRAYANAVRRFACAIILSFGHEMNGWWYPWGEHWTTPKEFIAAWRHIHDIFKKVGVGNVTWSWDPSHQYREVAVGKVASPASEWYPGNKYVDMIGLDGYLGYDRNGSPQHFKEIFGFQLHDIRRIAPRMPVYLAETGVSPGPAATNQIKELFAGVASYHLAGLLWFDAVGQPDATGVKKDYQLQDQPDMAGAYKKYLGNFLR
jgi:mannan endo-1,4-beta-mannosidase